MSISPEGVAPIQAVVFDLDGTLIDSTEAIVNSFRHLFGRIGHEFPGAQAIIDTIGFPLHEQLPLLTVHPVEECIGLYRAHYAATSCAATTLIPGALELLACLRARGIRLGFASSKSIVSASMLLEHLGVLQFFDARIGPEHVRYTKPHPEPVFAALAGLGVEPAEAFFVGDMHFDLEAGAAAGVRTLGVATGYCSRAALEALGPEAVFDDLGQLQEYLCGVLSGYSSEGAGALWGV